MLGRYVLDNISEARSNLFRNKSRTLLTSLGIVIGITSVIILVAITNGAKSIIEQQLVSLGAKTIVLKPIGRTRSGVYRGQAQDFNQEELQLMKAMPTVAFVSPIVKTSNQITYANRTQVVAVVGSNEDFAQINDWAPDEGSFINRIDVQDGAKVCVLGASVNKRFFGALRAVDKFVRIDGISFKVIGVLSEKGLTPGGRDQDDFILIPYTSLNRWDYKGQLYGISNIIISSTTTEDVEFTKYSIRRMLRERRSLLKDEFDNFELVSYEAVTKKILQTTTILKALLSTIASISLVVGGIGIMNIMLVSVTERTKEIGIRITIGAKSRDIVFQFLSEAALLSLIGGIIGVILGYVLSQMASNFVGWPAIISTKSIFVACIFSGLIGIFFGIYPAFKASRMDPIRAIRNE
ncbi:MAG: multidrug ABC transporter substrate-binding protein [Spirochaetales bacterium]|nr:multidrug ABC transporter substrate-binding protein [Spirochaetales bacterium]